MPRFLLVILLACVPVAADPVTRLAFGSCCRQNKPAPIFDSICQYNPDVWIWMGDNIYADTADPAVATGKYRRLATHAGYKALCDSCAVIGTWDDHDYGKNDAGKEFPGKKASQQRFLDFLRVPADDPRRTREGVYASHTYGDGDQAVKVILLDTRYHRDLPGPDADILGDAQWEWLENELTGSTAAVHLLVSSIQLVPCDHRFEKWADFPQAHRRLYGLLARDGIPPVTVLSGDRHLAEISVEKDAVPYPLHDITSSSLNSPGGGNQDEPNTRRLGENYRDANFGTLTIDWSTTPPTLAFAIRDLAGAPVREVTLRQER
ncbi:MAG: alkaline phosphatase family protein [Akkermansiaceae bacterium]|nr:alkaline phosphatase family protein [Akkermansiaceae bacterium]